MVKNYLDYAGLKRVLGKLFGIRKIWHGTATEWDALTPAERDYYDQAEIIDGEEMYPFEPHTYSTDEKRVGTWIDGKPIYRKVLLCTQQTVLQQQPADWQTVPGWSEIIPNIKQHTCISTGRNHAERIDHLYVNNILKFVCMFSSITIYKDDALIIEYTKTTD